jgi:putative phosphoribosyl transferase
MRELQTQTVSITVPPVRLEGNLALPQGTKSVVIFAHGSGSSRFSPRNTYVARVLNAAGIGTLLFDLLTRDEDSAYENRFNIELLTERLKAATRWLKDQPAAKRLSIGYFGASTGAAAALWAAADIGPEIKAVVSRGGRPDMAERVLGKVQSPTLLIVGGYDDTVIKLNQEAFGFLKSEKELKIIPRATHLFEEPGALEEAARLAAEWFTKHLLKTQK